MASGKPRVGAGNLNQRLRLESPVRSLDEGGGAAVVWTLVAEVWAEVWPVSGAERAAGGGAAGEAATTNMRARIYSAGHPVASDMRVVWRGHVFNVRAVVWDGVSPMMVLDLQSGVAT